MLSFHTSLIVTLSWILSAYSFAQISPGSNPKLRAIYKIGKEEVTLDELLNRNNPEFYELELKRYELIQQISEHHYLENFWKRLAEKDHTSEEEARRNYLKPRIKVSETDIQSTIERLKGQPRFQDLKDSDRRSQAIEFLESLRIKEITNQLVQQAIRSKELVVLYPKPQEPLYSVEISDQETSRYGALPEETNPVSCRNKECLTIVEYGEFQCPFTKQSQQIILRILAEYRGRVRFVSRDFIMGFHIRSRPATIAAKCAALQNKYWHMHDSIFENQRSLSDQNLTNYAKSIGLELAPFESCRNNPQSFYKAIEANISSGRHLGVTSTPTYFVGTRRVTGSPTIEEFRTIIEEELAKQRRGISKP